MDPLKLGLELGFTRGQKYLKVRQPPPHFIYIPPPRKTGINKNL